MGERGRRRKGRGGGPSGDVSDQAFCLKSAPARGFVGMSSPNFSRRRDRFWPTNKKVIARILIQPKCSYTVS